MAALKVTPGPEQLEAAFKRCRRRHWPATLLEAQSNPLIAKLIELEAWCHARREAAKALHQARAARKAMPPAAKGPSPHIPQQPLALDHKRRAAGERDDD